MGKIRRRAFVLCLLALLFPLTANAVPKIELTAYVEAVADDKSSMKVLVVDDTHWNVLIEKFTKVGIKDLRKAVGTFVYIKGYYAQAEGGILALEVDEGVLGESKLEGTITKTNEKPNDPIITIIGHDIPLPDGVELKDILGNTIDIADFGQLADSSVKVEGYTDGSDDYFHITAVKEIKAFYCANSSTYFNMGVGSLSGADTDIPRTKVTVEYCELDNGKRTGVTEYFELVYPTLTDDATLSNYTFGKWKDGKPDGYWLTIDVTGRLLRWCRYKRGDLNRKDSWQEISSCLSV